MYKAVKILAIVFVIYVGIVALFEALLGYFQPEADNTLVITTTAPDGSSHQRVLTGLESNDQLYVAVNHWPRAWYRHTLQNSEVQVDLNGGPRDYRALPVSDEVDARLREEHPIPLPMRALMGFAPRHFVHLQPRADG